MVVDPGGVLIPFDDFVSHHKGELIGDGLWAKHGAWPMYSKFFDNLQALPFHVHHRDHHAALVDKPGKPEAYYYSPHMNNHLGEQPISFLGLQPETTKEQVKEHLMRFGEGGDNRITDLARGYRTQLGTGWDIPAGVLHAPASVCTYEPQVACDVFCMCESWSNNREVPEVPYNAVDFRRQRRLRRKMDRLSFFAFQREGIDREARSDSDDRRPRGLWCCRRPGQRTAGKPRCGRSHAHQIWPTQPR